MEVNRLMTTANNLRRVFFSGTWSNWGALSNPEEVWNAVPDQHGIYILRANKPIPRIRGESDILYVGITITNQFGLRKRLYDHARSSNEYNRHLSSASRFIAPDLLGSIGISIEYSYCLEGDLEARKQAEANLLNAYRQRHIELPPGNSNLPMGGYQPIRLMDTDYF